MQNVNYSKMSINLYFLDILSIESCFRNDVAVYWFLKNKTLIHFNSFSLVVGLRPNRTIIFKFLRSYYIGAEKASWLLGFVLTFNCRDKSCLLRNNCLLYNNTIVYHTFIKTQLKYIFNLHDGKYIFI